MEATIVINMHIEYFSRHYLMIIYIPGLDFNTCMISDQFIFYINLLAKIHALLWH